ncbi:MAG: TaqI-like C-terminal specificity domain-containing protein, partial [Longimicrobiales bacterium]
AGQICWGVKTGLNDAFFIDATTRAALIEEDAHSAELIMPLAAGDDIRHYNVRARDRFLIYVPHGTDMNRYPAVLKHLSHYRERLMRRATSASHEWYELQQPQEAYRSYFESTKIVFPDIGTSPRFALDDRGRYCSNTAYFLPSSDLTLLAMLNSRLSFFLLKHLCAQLEGPGQAYLRFFGHYMERLPIRRVEQTTPEEMKRELSTWLMSLYHRGLRRAGVEPEVPADIRELGCRIGEIEGVQRVLLFGSWARGDAHQDSDVDLLVVDAPNGDRAQRYVDVSLQIGPFARPIDLQLLTPEEFARQRSDADSFVARVIVEGLVLHDG